MENKKTPTVRNGRRSLLEKSLQNIGQPLAGLGQELVEVDRGRLVGQVGDDPDAEPGQGAEFVANLGHGRGFHVDGRGAEGFAKASDFGWIRDEAVAGDESAEAVPQAEFSTDLLDLFLGCEVTRPTPGFFEGDLARIKAEGSDIDIVVQGFAHYDDIADSELGIAGRGCADDESQAGRTSNAFA